GVAGINVDIQAFGVGVPEQLGFDSGGQGGVFQALGEIRLGAGRARFHVGVDLELVVDFLDPLDSQGDLFGQIAVHVAFDIAGQACYAVLHIDVDGEGV